MIKAVFFDIDGTLISMKTRKITETLLAALYQLKENGIRLFVATGRPPAQLPLLDPRFTSFPWDGWIMMNGQYCMDENRQCFASHPIPKETLEVLIPWLKDADFPCSVMEAELSYELRWNQNRYDHMKAIGRIEDMPPILDAERAFSHDTYQYSAYIPEAEDAEFLAHAPGMKAARWSVNFADMIPAEGGKPKGMERMMERFGLKREECMACGDGGNDITMIQYAGIGVAMGNSREEVKKAADHVTGDCEDDGLVAAFEHFGLL